MTVSIDDLKRTLTYWYEQDFFDCRIVIDRFNAEIAILEETDYETLHRFFTEVDSIVQYHFLCAGEIFWMHDNDGEFVDNFTFDTSVEYERIYDYFTGDQVDELSCFFDIPTNYNKRESTTRALVHYFYFNSIADELEKL